MKIEFTVFGEPKPKGRPRFFRRGHIIGTYTPKETELAEEDFKMQSLKHKPEKPFEGAIILSVAFHRSIPKSFSKKKRELALNGGMMPLTKPDIDNLFKLVMDSLNGIYWRDDSQVILIKAGKFYSHTPRTEIEIEG